MNFAKIYMKLRTVAKILFSDRKHWIFISMNKEDLKKHFQREPMEFHLTYHGLMRVTSERILLDIGSQIDQDQLILDEAEFSADAENYSK